MDKTATETQLETILEVPPALLLDLPLLLLELPLDLPQELVDGPLDGPLDLLLEPQEELETFTEDSFSSDWMVLEITSSVLLPFPSWDCSNNTTFH
jgi:hypothetical protein